MGKIVAFVNLTLDGVMQAPAGPDEDRRDNFKHGGWGAPYAAMEQVGDSKSNTNALLLGRRTYEQFYSVWPHRTNNPYTEVLNNTQKYVASTTLQEPLPWINSTLLKGDATEAMSALKQEADKDFLIMGSGVLIQSLMRRNLIDEYVLLIHPLVLGSGRRLFPDGGSFTQLQLTKTKTTSNGVIIATYRPVTNR
ncbi:dihydrofolate reductase family protein [Dictyobacter aurantiacus]|uniref:Deaminase reductase n=1 Tax=Dictyobacter aurantiacus TaxID=1936993 RepID=A0A401ZRD5_9CHLR|nr:dihydrofolate reductase family protein [Dictyobacter aurantiacus]GCE09437.1 deaminase reductase [Dictyobacter aurantiacus]